MVRFETFEEISCLKDSETIIQKVNEILSFINDKGGKAEITYYSLSLGNNEFYFNLATKIPVQVKTPT